MELDWTAVGSAAATIGLVYAMIRNFKSDIDHKLSNIQNDITKIRNDITDIKERLAFLEAANIYTMPLEPASNQRSQAAKELWRKRRAKKIEHKEGK